MSRIAKRPNHRPAVRFGKFLPTKQKKPTSEMYGENWEELSSYVRKRDNYSCRIAVLDSSQRCSNRFPPPFHNLLHAHHIVPLPKGSNHPSNLISLCVECHGKLHKKYLGKVSEKQKRAARKY